MTYSDRCSPDVSKYVANLNIMPSAQDLQSSSPDNFNLNDELAMFTNTQFFDFDAGQVADMRLGGFASDEPAGATAAPEKRVYRLDFIQGV